MKKLIKLVFWSIALAVLLSFAYTQIYSIFPIKYYNEIVNASEKYNLDPYLLLSIIKAESNFKTDAVSSKGASGLMQLTQQTAAWCSIKMDYEYTDIFDTKTNIDLGTFYFSYLLEKYESKELAIAAYNAGHGNVDKWLSNSEFSENGETLNKIPFPETDKYLKKILFYEKVYNFLYRGRSLESSSHFI